MTAGSAEIDAAAGDAGLALAVCALDPAAIGGVILRGPHGPTRDLWVERLSDLLPSGTPVRRVPMGVTEGRLLGGLDLVRTLRAGRPVAERGLLAECDGGVVLLPGAERVAPIIVAGLCAALDTHEARIERDGIADLAPARLGLVAFDESLEEEAVPLALSERLAIHLDLRGLRPAAIDEPGLARHEIDAARTLLPAMATPNAIVEALCATALALGIGSLRAPVLALRVAQAVAALHGRAEVAMEDAAAAARLVLAPRATRLPQQNAEPDEADPPPPTEADDAPEQPEPPPPPPPEDQQSAESSEPLGGEDIVLEAAKAALPLDLLARIKLAGGDLGRARSSGRSGAMRKSNQRGRPAGTIRGDPRRERLDVVETLRVAAPWQVLRRRDGEGGRVLVQPEDFRIRRRIRRARTTTIFIVDASGSAAFQRLAEAKGAVELLLAECYVRRDEVALVAFRDRAAEVLLPPTRSLVRAKRSLAALPGGGATPLAAGLDAGGALADAVRRKGDTPILIILTDGRANISRDGRVDRAQASQDAVDAARRLRGARCAGLLVDTAARPDPTARVLAEAMGVLYLPLPRADSAALSRMISTAAQIGAGR
jgi:magnesium chelatase subunit D